MGYNKSKKPRRKRLKKGLAPHPGGYRDAKVFCCLCCVFKTDEVLRQFS